MTFDELNQSKDFSEVTTVDYSDIKNFVFTELSKNRFWTSFSRIYQITGGLTLFLVIIMSISNGVIEDDWSFLLAVAIGALFSFTVLILFHELIHMVAYRYLGIRKLSMGMNLSKFEFFVEADKQVINYTQSQIVALAPAFIIGLASIVGAVVCISTPVSFAFLSIFSLHSFLCTGDFGLLCFFDNRPELEIVTFDLTKERKVCFFGKNKNIQYTKS